MSGSSENGAMRLKPLLAAALTGVLLAACGGGTGDPPAPPAPAPGPAPAPAPAPARSPAPAPTPAPPPIAVTPAGIPEGLPTFATIGASGGTLVSSDGRLTVTVPAGALAGDTEVGIQPITATAPGALGAAYRLTPEGRSFAQPATLTFRYSAEEAGASAPSALRVATQDAQGRWGLPATTSDASMRTLSVATTHFSDWSYVSGEQLRPASASVLVGTSQPLQYSVCGDADDGRGGDDENHQRFLLPCTDVHSPFPARWAVNGINGGNASIGRIGPPDVSRDWYGVYDAPATVPSPNPVAASVTWGDQAQLTLVSQLTVVAEIPAYEGTFASRFNAATAGAESKLLGNVRFAWVSTDPQTGALTYQGSGRAQLSGRFTAADGRACVWDTATGDLQSASSLIVLPAGNGDLSKRYQIALYAQAMSTLRCDGSDPAPGPLVVSHSVSVDQQCALPSYEELWQFAGSWNCTLPGSGSTSANWTLYAHQ